MFRFGWVGGSRKSDCSDVPLFFLVIQIEEWMDGSATINDNRKLGNGTEKWTLP